MRIQQKPKATRTPIRLHRFRNTLRSALIHPIKTRSLAKHRVVLLLLPLTTLTQRENDLLGHPSPWLALFQRILREHRFELLHIGLESLLLRGSLARNQARKQRSALQADRNHAAQQRARSALPHHELLSRRSQGKQPRAIQGIADLTGGGQHSVHLLHKIVSVESVNRTPHEGTFPAVNLFGENALPVPRENRNHAVMLVVKLGSHNTWQIIPTSHKQSDSLHISIAFQRMNDLQRLQGAVNSELLSTRKDLQNLRMQHFVNVTQHLLKLGILQRFEVLKTALHRE